MNSVDTITSNNINEGPTVLDLVDAYNASVYKLCRSLAYSKEEAEDLFQETFLKAVEQQALICSADKPEKFLFSITIYIWKSWKRKYARRNRIIAIEPLKESAVSTEDVEETILKQEEARCIAAAVNNLPDRLRVPVILYYTVEADIADIALILKIPQGTVKSRLYKARKVIKKELEAVDNEEIR